MFKPARPGTARSPWSCSSESCGVPGEPDVVQRERCARDRERLAVQRRHARVQELADVERVTPLEKSHVVPADRVGDRSVLAEGRVRAAVEEREGPLETQQGHEVRLRVGSQAHLDRPVGGIGLSNLGVRECRGLEAQAILRDELRQDPTLLERLEQELPATMGMSEGRPGDARSSRTVRGAATPGAMVQVPEVECGPMMEAARAPISASRSVDRRMRAMPQRGGFAPGAEDAAAAGVSRPRET